MKVLVTGGSGLLATHIIAELIRQKISVRCTIRDKNKFRLQQKDLVELLEGDISDSEFLNRACEGCDFVIHAAAQTPGIVNDEKVFHAVNVTGTSNLLRASVKQNVKKLIYVSTANTVGFGSKDQPGDERAPIKIPFVWSSYANSKLKAEELVRSYKDRLEVVIVNPTFLLGSHIDESGSGQLITRAFKKRSLFYPPGGKNLVHTADAALAIVNALHYGRNGERYLLSGDTVSFKRIYKLAAEESRFMASWLLPLPSVLLRVIGIIGSALNFVGVNTNLTYGNISIFLIENHYSNQKATDELKVTFRGAHEIIKDSVNWIEYKRSSKPTTVL